MNGAVAGARFRSFGMEADPFPGIEQRLLIPAEAGREDRAAYAGAGGYGGGRLTGPDLVEATSSAGLRGRGGAAFPAATKMHAVLTRPGPRFVIANGAEGEPMSVKDRWLMRTRPHLVIDGLLLAKEAVQADEAYLYVCDPESSASVSSALAELDPPADSVRVVTVPDTYVAGEETAAVRAVCGRTPKPAFKPPRPFEAGVNGGPTLVMNVETISHLPFIAAHGAARFRELGTAESAGTTLLTLSGSCRRPGLYEVPFGVPLGALVEATAGTDGEITGFVMGGFFGGLIGAHAAEIPFTYGDLKAAGSGLGSAAIALLGPGDCPVAAAADVMAFFSRENARQCGSCFNGTKAMRDVLISVAHGAAAPKAVDNLRRWASTLSRRGACTLLDGATGLVRSLFREFPGLVDDHLAARCVRCDVLVDDATLQDTRFRLSV